MDETAPTVVVVGASAGGVEALTTLAAGLPKDLDAAVCIVLHLSPGTESRLAAIISRAGPLPAVQARGGERLVSGRIYVAPPDHHLIVRGRHLRVAQGPHENGVRPSIDALFRSAARSYARRTVAVVLSGARDDGVAGASAVEACGGCVFVQDPDDALFSDLPIYTVTHDHPDRVLPLPGLAPAIATVIERLSEQGDRLLEERPSDGRAGPDLVRGLRIGRGAVHDRHAARRDARRGRVQAARQDLRDRH